MSFTLVSRGGWNARAPRSAVTTRAVETYLHHSAGDHRGAVGVRSIQNFHMDKRGWSDIAYNFLVDRLTLVVYEGRGWGIRPGSQKNYNTGTWSVCVMGNFDSHVPSEGLLDTIVALMRHGIELGHLPSTLTGGHKDAPGQSTRCPGATLYPQIPYIRRHLTKKEEPLVGLPIDKNSNAEDIRLVQGRLGIKDDAVWGSVTTSAVAALAVRANTGDPNGKNGSRVNGRMYNRLALEFVARHSGGGDGHSHDGRYVKSVIVSK